MLCQGVDMVALRNVDKAVPPIGDDAVVLPQEWLGIMEMLHQPLVKEKREAALAKRTLCRIATNTEDFLSLLGCQASDHVEGALDVVENEDSRSAPDKLQTVAPGTGADLKDPHVPELQILELA